MKNKIEKTEKYENKKEQNEDYLSSLFEDFDSKNKPELVDWGEPKGREIW